MVRKKSTWGFCGHGIMVIVCPICVFRVTRASKRKCTQFIVEIGFSISYAVKDGGGANKENQNSFGREFHMSRLYCLFPNRHPHKPSTILLFFYVLSRQVSYQRRSHFKTIFPGCGAEWRKTCQLPPITSKVYGAAEDSSSMWVSVEGGSQMNVAHGNNLGGINGKVLQ